MYKNIDEAVEEKFEGVQFTNSDGANEYVAVGKNGMSSFTDLESDYYFFNKDITKIIKALKIMHKHYTGEEI